MPEGVPERRYAILAEGWFADRHAKTAHGLSATAGTRSSP